MAKKQLKKEWYEIIAPKIFRNVSLGETFVFDPQTVIGKGMTVNLMTLTNNPRNQNVKVNFVIKKIQDNKAQAHITGCELVASSIKRMVRRNIEKIEDSFTCKTSDGVMVRIKPLIIARKTTSGSVATAVRKKAQEAIEKAAQAMKFEAFANDVVFHKIQDTLKKQLSKVYPIKMCEIKHLSVVAADKMKPVAVEATTEPAAEAEAKSA